MSADMRLALGIIGVELFIGLCIVAAAVIFMAREKAKEKHWIKESLKGR
jgi:hypothetical protein